MDPYKKTEKSKTLQEDLERIAADGQLNWEQLRGKKLFVTGATGLIGGILTRGLLLANQRRGLNLQVLALVRSEEKARRLFEPWLEEGAPLHFLQGDVQALPAVEQPVDFIIHGANCTVSREFVERPVETIWTALAGTRQVLGLAEQKQVKSMVYLSSMEVYGVTDAAHERVREMDYGYLDPLQTRSSYPESKRMAEGLCGAYASEYQVPVKTARLAQTFGPGIPGTENRVFAQFARSILNGQDIVLHTDGSKAHCYCYTVDAVRGILTILLAGENGQAYNVSNEATFCTILEMAQLLIRSSAGAGSRLVFDIPENIGKYGYAPTSRMKICAEKLNALGWQAQVSLEEMLERLMRYMREMHMETLPQE